MSTAAAQTVSPEGGQGQRLSSGHTAADGVQVTSAPQAAASLEPKKHAKVPKGQRPEQNGQFAQKSKPVQNGPAAPAPEPGFVVELIEGRDAFCALEKEWNQALSRGPRDEPMLRHEWVRAWVESFAPGAPLRVFLARAGGELHAAIALVERRDRGADTCWLPMTTWHTPVNDHSQRGGLLLGRRGAEALPALFERLVATSGWDRLLLRDLPGGAPEWALHGLARKAGYPTGLWVSLRSPYLTLPEGKGAARYEAVLAATDAKFRQNLRRRRRRLEEQGAVTYALVDNKDAAALDEGLADFYELEASGWKGQEGSAIALDPKLVGYYTQLARDAARRGALRLGFLSVGGKRIAGHLAMHHQGCAFLVKVGYDERYQEFSPGQQLAAEAIRAACAEGLAAFDFLGPAMGWKADWEPALRTHRWLTIFRPTGTGHFVHALRFTGWPVARALSRRIRGA